jgi:predicted HicB family RNase H-like nuclease
MQLEYKGYEGTAIWDEEAQIFHGRLDILTDVITFQGNAAAVKQDFQDAVDDYLDFRAEKGKEPNKPLKVLEQGLKDTNESTLTLPEYKGYEAVAEWSREDGVFFGSVSPYKGLLSIEGYTLKGIITAFKKAVDDELRIKSNANTEDL